MATPVDKRLRAKTPARYSPDEILRFEACERQLHWSIAIPFTICYLTALVLVAVYNPAPTRPYRIVFAWVHRLSGLCLTLLPPLILFIHRREFRKHLGNIRDALSWGLDELKWLLLLGPSMLSRRVQLPHQGKFNAAEKINFIMVMSTYPLYIATGLTIWFLRPAYVSWMIHLAMALAATPLVLGHVFMATVNPDTRVGLSGMISGWVNREWAHHHYRRWYDEQFGPLGHVVHAAPAVRIAAAPEPATATTVRQILPLRPDIAPAAPALSRPAAASAPTPVRAPAVLPRVAVRPAVSGLTVTAPRPALSRPAAPAPPAQEWEWA